MSHDPRDVQYLGGDVVLFSENGQTDFLKIKVFGQNFLINYIPNETHPKLPINIRFACKQK